MLRVGDDLPRRPFLDDAPQVHDGDPVGEVGCGREVVGDHEDPEPAPAKLVEKGKDAGSDGDVEHGDRLVGEEKLRVEHEARGDRNALALTARELVREAVDEELGRRQPGPRERFANTLLALGTPPPPSPWTRSGSSTVARTRKRGSSDS